MMIYFIIGYFIVGAIVFFLGVWNDWRMDNVMGPGFFAIFWPLIAIFFLLFIFPQFIAEIAEEKIKNLKRSILERKKQKNGKAIGYREMAGRSCHECGQRMDERKEQIL